MKKKLLIYPFLSLGLIAGSASSLIFKPSNDDEIQNVNALAATNRQNSKYNVGQGKKWDDHVLAPFVDMTSWTPEYNLNGAPSLSAFHQGMGANYFNLGFIQATGGVHEDGYLNWGWGGFGVLNEENGQDNQQYQGIKKSIRDFRSIGGDITISFGGASGMPFWLETSDVDVLAKTYVELIEGYGLTTIDLDIEGAGENIEANKANALAIKKAQDLTNVDVILTFPVLPSGLTYTGYANAKAYVDAGVDIKYFNLMTMCFGELSAPNGYAVGAVDAVDSTKDQLIEIYGDAGSHLSDSEAYALLGSTPSIGYESTNHPIFTLEDSQMVVDHAIEHKIGQLSYWAENRDAKVGGYASNSGIDTPYEFGNLYREFSDWNDTIEPQPSAPEILNVSEIQKTSALLKWNEPVDSDVEITNYEIEIKDLDENSYNLISAGKVDQYRIENLMVGTNYMVKVRSVGVNGEKSDWSNAVEFQTQDIANRPVAPTNLEANNIGETSFELSFTDNNEYSDIYKIEVKDIKTSQVTKIDSTTTNVLIDSLKDSTQYSVRIKAGKEIDGTMYYSPYSDSINVMTMKPEVGPVQDFDSNTNYTESGTLVKYNGHIWRNKWYISANTTTPSEEDPYGVVTGWEIADGTIFEWNETASYPEGSKVYYNGQVWEAQYWASAGDKPGVTSNWVLFQE